MKNIKTIAVSALAVAGLAGCVSNTVTQNEIAAAPIFKPARVEVQSQDYFGTIIEDPYQWMEKEENQAELKEWMLEQGKVVADIQNQNPYREKIYQRLLELDEKSVSFFYVQKAKGKLFYQILDEESEQPKLMVRDSNGENDRLLLDPDELKKQYGDSVSIDTYSPSPDGKYVAYNLSVGGAELTDIYFIEVETGKVLEDKLEWIWGEFGASWLPDSSGVLYTRMRPESKLDANINKLHHMQVYLHRLGQSVENDVPVLGNDVNDSIEFLP